MKRFVLYGLSCSLLVVGVGLGLYPLLDPVQLDGLMLAGAVAVGLQLASFAARVRWATTPNRLLATWVWSTGTRFAAVLAMALAAWRFEGLDVVTSLVGLAGFLFVMLLMEPAFFAPGRLELDDGEIARG